MESQTKTLRCIYPPFELNKPQTAPIIFPLSPRREPSHAGKRKRSAAPWTKPLGLREDETMTCPDAQQKWHIDLRFLVNFCW